MAFDSLSEKLQNVFKNLRTPVAACFFVQPGAGCQGCIAPPFYGGLPLTVCPGCAISPASGGGISSRAAPFPMIGKGRGDWVELSY